MSKFDPPASKFDPPVSAPPMYTTVPNPESGNPNGGVIHQARTKEDILRIVVLGLRGLSLLFSFLCFIVTAAVKNFGNSDTLNYVFSISILSFIYNTLQISKGVYMLTSRREFISHQKVLTFVDFIGDQVMTYMLISASTVGLAVANEARQAAEAFQNLTGLSSGTTVDKVAGGTSMLFFAFLALVFPTLVSGHKLSQALTTR